MDTSYHLLRLKRVYSYKLAYTGIMFFATPPYGDWHGICVPFSTLNTFKENDSTLLSPKNMCKAIIFSPPKCWLFIPPMSGKCWMVCPCFTHTQHTAGGTTTISGKMGEIMKTKGTRDGPSGILFASSPYYVENRVCVLVHIIYIYIYIMYIYIKSTYIQHIYIYIIHGL